MKSSTRYLPLWHTPTLSQVRPRKEQASASPRFTWGWLEIIAMSGLPEGEPAGVTLESHAPRQSSSSGGVRYLPESPGYLYQGRPREVLSEVSSINFEIEAGDGDAPQQPPPGGSQTVRSVTNGSAVGGSLQQKSSLIIFRNDVRTAQAY
jgi:hypothetical protein